MVAIIFIIVVVITITQWPFSLLGRKVSVQQKKPCNRELSRSELNALLLALPHLLSSPLPVLG